MSSIWRDICVNCDIGIGTLTALATTVLPWQHKRLRKMLGERILRITVKPFMDINTMIEERLTQCCVHVATVNDDTAAHQCAPFCAVQAWAPLSRQRISTATARNAAPVGLGPVISVRDSGASGGRADAGRVEAERVGAQARDAEGGAVTDIGEPVGAHD